MKDNACVLKYMTPLSLIETYCLSVIKILCNVERCFYRRNGNKCKRKYFLNTNEVKCYSLLRKGVSFCQMLPKIYAIFS